MRVTQRIYDFSGSILNLPSPRARVVFKNIPSGPGAGRFWKFKDAAEFQLWTLDRSGRRRQLVRRGVKQVYCLRDLVRVSGVPRSPGGPVYGACSEDGGARSVVLGTSVGWADRYPSDYYQQWIDVTGLRGRFPGRIDHLPGIVDADDRRVRKYPRQLDGRVSVATTDIEQVPILWRCGKLSEGCGQQSRPASKKPLVSGPIAGVI